MTCHQTSSDRVQCCVPFCKHTTAAERKGVRVNEYICAEHWKLTNKTLRRRYSQHCTKAESHDKKKHAALVVMWKQLKKQAIERGAGI